MEHPGHLELLGVSALHYSTGSTVVWKGSGVGFSSCAAPNYLLSRARVFWIAYQKFGSLIWKQSVALEEIEHRVQIEARVIPEVWNQSAESQSGSSRQ